MTFVQIEYFLTVAKCLNISEAARRLYLTQPTLSRQISAIEAELNFPLFYRGKKTLQLTPAGRRLAERFGHILDEYHEAVALARIDNLGVSGALNIGILEGHMVWGFFPALLRKFKEHSPNLQINVARFSFSGLAEGLYNRTLDLAVTMEFDAARRPGLAYRVMERAPNCLVVPRSHPLLRTEPLTLKDFRNEVFITNAADDSPAGLENILSSCREAGFTPRLKYAASLEQYMLLVEAGYGVAVLNQHNSLYQNPNLFFLHLPEIGEGGVVVMWNEEIVNPAVSVGIDLIQQMLQEDEAATSLVTLS